MADRAAGPALHDEVEFLLVRGDVVVDDVARGTPVDGEQLVTHAQTGALGGRGREDDDHSGCRRRLQRRHSPRLLSTLAVPGSAAGPEVASSLVFVAVDRVLLAEPRGFCAGVEKAIKALAWMVRVFEPPVYCYHEIVHNRHVVEQFRDQGVVFVDDVHDVPDGAPLMLSAHGSAPEVVVAAREGGRVVVDAVCPLVTKVHHELKVRAGKGYTVLYVGHQGHEEAVGTMAVAPEAVRLVQEAEDVDHLEELAVVDGEPPAVALLAQTTLSHDEWAGIVERARARFPELWMPNRSDLCFATTNRQSALKAIAAEADAVVVIGSDNSSNTMALAAVAADLGCPRVVRVNDAAELPDDLAGTVAVTAGASAPEALVEAVVARLAPRRGVEERSVTTEEEYFPPPPELRDLLRGLELTLSLLSGAPATPEDDADRGRPALALASDRDLAAADVLAALEPGTVDGSETPIGARMGA